MACDVARMAYQVVVHLHVQAVAGGEAYQQRQSDWEGDMTDGRQPSVFWVVWVVDGWLAG